MSLKNGTKKQSNRNAKSRQIKDHDMHKLDEKFYTIYGFDYHELLVREKAN